MFSLRSPFLTAAFFGSAILLPQASASVLIVDSTNGPYLQINTAVNAAVDGDVILVKSGHYPGFSIVNKSLSVIVDASAEVLITGSVQIAFLQAGQTVVLHRLLIETPTTALPELSTGVYATNNAGRIRIQGCTIRGALGAGLAGCSPAGPPSGFHAVQADNCADVAVELCDLYGGHAGNLYAVGCGGVPFTGAPGGSGLEASFSQVTIHDSVLQGGKGGSAWYAGGDGGNGVHLVSSTLFASNIASNGATGGIAGGANCVVPPVPGDGGHGLLLDGTSIARILGSTFTGNQPGSTTACGTFGANGQPITGGGSVKTLAGTAKSLGVLKVLRENQNAAFTFVASANDLAFLLISPTAEGLWAPGLRGVLMVGAPLIGPVGVGSVPGGGILNVPFTVPVLPPGLEGIEVHVQGALVPQAGLPTLTGCASLTLLDSLF